jgi:hypothetical protein
MRVDAEVVLDTVAVAIIPVVQRARQVELPVFAGAISCACDCVETNIDTHTCSNRKYLGHAV